LRWRRRTLIEAPAAVLASLLVLAAGLRGPAGRRPLRDARIVLFAGDFAFGLNYQDQRRERGAVHVLEARGYRAAIAGLDPLLRRADRKIVNLETVLTDRRTPVSPHKAYIHYDDARATIAVLRDYRIDAVSLANNHTMDQGPDGLADTLAALEESGIAVLGAGRDSRAAGRAFQLTLQAAGRRIAIALIGAFEYRRDYDASFEFYAAADRSGTAALDPRSVAAEIARVRTATPHSLVVVFPHWGSNYVWRSGEQRMAGHALIEAGADIVIGHGAHALQQIEFHRGRLILYSIGNFLFNANGRYRGSDPPSLSLSVELRVGGDRGRLRSDIRLHAIQSDNTRTDFRPRPATTREFVTGMSELALKSPTAFLSPRLRAGRDAVGPFLEIRDAVPVMESDGPAAPGRAS